MGEATTTIPTLSYVAVTVSDDRRHVFELLLMSTDRYCTR